MCGWLLSKVGELIEVLDVRVATERILHEIHSRGRVGSHFLIAIDGESGSGKSIGLIGREAEALTDAGTQTLPFDNQLPETRIWGLGTPY